MEEDKDINQNSEAQSSMFSGDMNLQDDASSMFSDSMFDSTESEAAPVETTENTEGNSSEISEIIDTDTEKSDDIIKSDEIDKSSVEGNINDLKDDESVENENFSESDIEVQSNIEETENYTYQEDSADSLITVRPVKFQHFKEANLNLAIKKNLDILQDIPMHITVELGRTKSTIKDIINMDIGSVVELNKIAGEQVEIYVNDKLVARGEVIVIEDKFGVRVVNTNIPKDMLLQ